MTVRESLSNMAIFLGSQGMKPESKSALFYLNRARRLVYPLDDWTHTIKYICVRICDRCFVLPEDCAAIRAAWCGRSNVSVVNEYYDAVDQDFIIREAGDKAKVFRTGISMAAPFNPNYDQLYFSAANTDDLDKVITITYKDNYGSRNTEKITLLDDFQLTGTSNAVKEIHSLSKNRTVGNVDIFSSSGILLYRMDPFFTNGRFEQYKIDGSLCCDALLLKCKLRFRDYTEDDYDTAIDIESIDALEFAAKAMYEKSQSNIKEYQANILLARTHLEISKEDFETSSRGYEKIRLPSGNQRDEYGRYS